MNYARPYAALIGIALGVAFGLRGEQQAMGDGPWSDDGDRLVCVAASAVHGPERTLLLGPLGPSPVF
jgi:hypothetical protein